MKRTLNEIRNLYEVGKNILEQSFDNIWLFNESKEFIDNWYETILEMYCGGNGWKTVVYKYYARKKYKSLLKQLDEILIKLTDEFNQKQEYDE